MARLTDEEVIGNRPNEALFRDGQAVELPAAIVRYLCDDLLAARKVLRWAEYSGYYADGRPEAEGGGIIADVCAVCLCFKGQHDSSCKWADAMGREK